MGRNVNVDRPITAALGVGSDETNRVLFAQFATDRRAGVPQGGAVTDLANDVSLGAGFARKQRQRTSVNLIHTAAENKRADRYSRQIAGVRVTDSNRVHQHAHAAGLCHHLFDGGLAGVVHAVGHHQQRLLVVAAMLNHQQAVEDRVEEGSLAERMQEFETAQHQIMIGGEGLEKKRAAGERKKEKVVALVQVADKL